MMLLQEALLFALIATLWSLSDAGVPAGCAKCGEGWTYKDGSCYKFFSEGMNYVDAQRHCKSMAATLPIPKTAKLEIAMHSMVPQKQNFWLGLDALTGIFKWNDSTPVNSCGYTNWHQGEPNNKGDDCAATIGDEYGHKWSARSCTEKFAVLCEKDPGFSKECLVCPSGWFLEWSVSLCYKYYQSISTNYAEALQKCKNVGGQLAVPKSPLEQTLVIHVGTKVGRYTDGFWIGLDDRKAEGEFLTGDGCQLGYTNWGHAEPNDYGGKQDCVGIYWEDNKWYDIHCLYQGSYMCQRDPTAATTPESPVNRCEPNPCKNGGSCLPTGPRLCECRPGSDKTGTFCDQGVSRCEPNPCQNGGGCLSSGPEMCDCKYGSIGKFCEFRPADSEPRSDQVQLVSPHSSEKPVEPVTSQRRKRRRRNRKRTSKRMNNRPFNKALTKPE